MHKGPAGADEEVVILGDVEVEHRLDRPRLDRLDGGQAVEQPERVARLEVARDHPALAGFPEAMEGAADDRLAGDVDQKRRARGIVVDDEDRLVPSAPVVSFWLRTWSPTRRVSIASRPRRVRTMVPAPKQLIRWKPVIPVDVVTLLGIGWGW